MTSDLPRAQKAIAQFNEWLDRWRREQCLPGTVLCLLDPKEVDGSMCLFISGILVPDDHRRNGLGSTMLQKALEMAERHGLPVGLEAEADGECSHFLEEWYGRRGFEYAEDGWGDYGPFMIRHGRPEPDKPADGEDPSP